MFRPILIALLAISALACDSAAPLSLDSVNGKYTLIAVNGGHLPSLIVLHPTPYEEDDWYSGFLTMTNAQWAEHIVIRRSTTLGDSLMDLDLSGSYSVVGDHVELSAEDAGGTDFGSPQILTVSGQNLVVNAGLLRTFTFTQK